MRAENPAWASLQRFLGLTLPGSAAWCFMLHQQSEGPLPHEAEFGDVPVLMARLHAYLDGTTCQSFAVRFPPPSGWRSQGHEHPERLLE